LPRSRAHRRGRAHAGRRGAARDRLVATRRVRSLLHAALARLHRPLHRAPPADGPARGDQPGRPVCGRAGPYPRGSRRPRGAAALSPEPTRPLSRAGAVLLGLAASALFLGFAPGMRRLADGSLSRPAYDTRALVREGSRAMGTFADPARVATAMADLIDGALH